MVFVNDGKNKIRDLLASDITHAQMGTGTTAESAADTALVSAVAATSLAVSLQTSDKQIVVDYNVPSTVGNGTDFTELGVFNGSNVLFSRHVFSSLTKSSTEQWQISVIYKIL